MSNCRVVLRSQQNVEPHKTEKSRKFKTAIKPRWFENRTPRLEGVSIMRYSINISKIIFNWITPKSKITGTVIA